jgi:hypothetical protein
MEPIRVLIVDDHAPFRDGLRALLRSEADIEAIGAIPHLDLPQWVRMIMVSSCKQYSLALAILSARISVGFVVRKFCMPCTEANNVGAKFFLKDLQQVRANQYIHPLD